MGERLPRTIPENLMHLDSTTGVFYRRCYETQLRKEKICTHAQFAWSSIRTRFWLLVDTNYAMYAQKGLNLNDVRNVDVIYTIKYYYLTNPTLVDRVCFHDVHS